MSINKSDPVINLSINAPSKSMSKILILVVDPDDHKQFQHTEKFKNLDITKVNIGIEGVEKVNALYASGMEKWRSTRSVLTLDLAQICRFMETGPGWGTLARA